MGKTNRFYVKEFEENKITVEEERRDRSPFILFLIRNGKLIFGISLILSISIFVIGIYYVLSNMKDSSIVMYETNGVTVTFDDTDNSILNGTPITEEYASKLFDSNIVNSDTKGVIIKIKEVSFGSGKIIYYSDKTALVKYKNGEYLRVFPVDNDYGINENGTLNAKAVTKSLTGEIKVNDKLGITLLYLSDGSIEVTKDKTTIFVRNSDITSNEEKFFTNLSIVSVPIKKEGNKVYFSNGTIKDNDKIVVNGTEYKITSEKKIHDGIKITYYENGFALVEKDNLMIIVEKKDHIVYDDNIFEIITDEKEEVDIKDFIDIKDIKLQNNNNSSSTYLVVLEETDNYQKHKVSRRLDNKYIKYDVYVNGNKTGIKVLDNNLKDSSDINGLPSDKNNYFIYEGKIDKLSELSIKIGMWVDYRDITNEYMNSAFIGTVKVYIENNN